jgi:RND superfamily putative drug exporter
VLVDATIVRMILVPSTMALMGDANWWLPRWLDRMLPHIDVEGASVIDALEVPVPHVVEEPVASELDDDERELVGVG